MQDLIGSTIWARKTITSEIFFNKPAAWFKIWFFIIQRVNHKDHRGFKRGECLTTYKEISYYTNTTVHQIEAFIKWGKATEMLTTRKTTRGIIIFVLRYAEYQDAIKRKSQTEPYKQTIDKPDRNHTINKNDKNEKNEKASVNFLTNIPSEDMEDLKNKLHLSDGQIKKKAEELYDYCQAKGKKYKNYKAFLRNALRRDYDNQSNYNI